jgi:molybdopterin converting factor small subunit
VKDSLRVTVEIVPWLTDHFGHKGHGRLRIEETVPQGTTILALLNSLAERHAGFGRVALPNGELSGAISVLLNNRWLQPSHNLDYQLEDSDTVTLLPAFTGGVREEYS